MIKVAVVFGAAGFIGQNICRLLLARGFEVRACVRNLATASTILPPEVRLFLVNLPQFVDESAFVEGAIVIHCAYAMEFLAPKERNNVNVAGSEKIITMSRFYNAHKVIFLSSMSAHGTALSDYGRTKLVVEGLLDKNRDLIVKPGFVIGNGSNFKKLVNTIHSSLVIPLFYMGRQRIQTIAIDDLCEGILRSIYANLTGTIHLAEPKSVTITSFYRTIARSQELSRIYIPIPGTPVLLLVKLLEYLGVRLPFSSENLLGLKKLIEFNVAADLDKIDLKPKMMESSVLEFAAKYKFAPKGSTVAYPSR